MGAFCTKIQRASSSFTLSKLRTRSFFWPKNHLTKPTRRERILRYICFVVLGFGMLICAKPTPLPRPSQALHLRHDVHPLPCRLAGECVRLATTAEWQAVGIYRSFYRKTLACESFLYLSDNVPQECCLLLRKSFAIFVVSNILIKTTQWNLAIISPYTKILTPHSRQAMWLICNFIPMLNFMCQLSS